MINEILAYVKPKRKILLVTHNNPDPDSIASAYALLNLFRNSLRKRCTITYRGIIGRSENKELLQSCKIEMYNSSRLNFSRYDCIILVDTQPTAGNVYFPDGYFPSIVIDHHNFRAQSKNACIYDIRPESGSTSSIISEYYRELDVDININVATALYYGIKTDTTGAGRSNTKNDLAIMSYLLPHISLKKLSKIENPELPRYYFKNMYKALGNIKIIEDVIFCDLGEVRNADLVAETSDFFLKMRDMKWTFITGAVDNICYFSLRCKSTKRKVSYIALSIVRGLGSGGGHMKSAGGQISLDDKKYSDVVEVLKNRLIHKIGVVNPEEKEL